jgi:hypothetical protein
MFYFASEETLEKPAISIKRKPASAMVIVLIRQWGR